VTDFFAALGNAVVDRSPDELIGAVIFAMTLSLVMAGLYYVGRRQLRENMMPMIVLMLVANLVSVAVGAGYLTLVKKNVPGPLTGARHGRLVGSEAMWVEAIFRAADLNRDGLLTGEEASRAADQFVRSAVGAGNGAIDSETLCHAILAKDFHIRAWSRLATVRRERYSEDPSLHSESPSPADMPHSGTHPEPEVDSNGHVSRADPGEAPFESAP
jgi:hypothetical protein